MKKIIWILFGIIIILFSCEKYIDMEIPDRGRKLVANCLYSDTGEVYVNLSMSRFILDNSDFVKISGATVILFENGQLADTLTEFLPGKYKTNGFVPQTGSTQSIKIIKDNITIHATSSIPYPVSFEFLDTMRISSEYYEYLRFRIKINDPLNEENYYMIGFEKEAPFDPFTIGNHKLYFTTNEPFIEQYSHSYGIFSDVLFKGQNQILSFDLDIYGFDSDTNKVFIQLFSLSKEMYLYLLTLSAQQNASFSPFAEPVIVFNNIENGYGIFGGFSMSSDTILIPRLSYGWGYIE